MINIASHWNSSEAIPGAAASARPQPTETSSSAATAAPSTISANDFLTLLVTEMKNQDPTAQTDPNEYINQLVQVNSLEQLIQINQTLSSSVPDPSAGLRSDQPAASARSNSVRADAQPGAPAPRYLTQDASGAPAVFTPTNKVPEAISGNLSAPSPLPAAQRLALALSGRNQ